MSYGPPSSQINFAGDYSEPVTHGMRSGANSGSSNAYASGANQNTGNFITDRTTTRVQQAPGGASQISFGNYEAPPAQQRRNGPPPSSQISFGGEPQQERHGAPSGGDNRSSNSFANGNNQNVGNSITDRTTTKVTHEPGGRSQIQMGSYTLGDDRGMRNSNQQHAQEANPIQRMGRCGPPPASQISFGDAPEPVRHGAPSGGDYRSSNSFANGNNQNVGNSITDRSTTRISHEPGGRSQIQMGSYTLGDDRGMRQANQSHAQEANPIQRMGRNGPPPSSQISFGDAHSEPVRHGAPSGGDYRSSNSFANGNNQNVGNSITDRPTTKVQQPPGGRSQISFGQENAAPYQAPMRH